MNDETENHVSMTDFEKARPYIFACPASQCWNPVDEDIPVFDACFMTWELILQDADDEDKWETVTEEMMKRWDVQPDQLIHAAIDNINGRQSDVVFTTLFGRASEDAVIPFMKIHYANGGEGPPFGCTLILSDEVMSRVRWYLGDFYAFPSDMNSFYAISNAQLQKHRLDPVKSFLNIMENGAESKPNFFEAQFLFDAATTRKKRDGDWHIVMKGGDSLPF